MKKIILIIGSLLFSTLFYKQNLGLNLTLFSLISTIILYIHNPKSFKNRATIILSGLFVLCACNVFFHPSLLAVIAYSVAFFTLLGTISQHNTSIYINWLNGFYTFIAGFFERKFNNADNEKQSNTKADIDYIQWFKIIGIPLVVISVFIALYRNGNPVFERMIANIDFNFLNFQWILLSLLGYYLLSNISEPATVNPLTKNDLKTGNNLKIASHFSEEHIKKENQLGVILISLLNGLIVLFLITDFIYLFTAYDLRASVFSNQVHSGINALIASIVIAIAIMLYFFRGDLNFYKNNTTLKSLTYGWIILNSILVLNTAIKDMQYIYYFGLTYKRIGVIIYLILTIIGLTTTAIKVISIKNFYYLLRVNTVTAFVILMGSCMLNWDKHITYYNLNYAQSMDFKYLINLSNSNTFLLKEYSDYAVLDKKYKRLVKRKYKNYLKQLNENNWQEWTYDNIKLKKASK